jgi:hypothetical protein
MPKPASWAGLHEIKFARALHSHQNVINLTHSRAIRAHPNPAKSSPSGPGLPKAGAFFHSARHHRVGRSFLPLESNEPGTAAT